MTEVLFCKPLCSMFPSLDLDLETEFQIRTFCIYPDPDFIIWNAALSFPSLGRPTVCHDLWGCWTSTRGRTPLFSSSPAPILVRYRHHVLRGCWISTRGRTPLLTSYPDPHLVRDRYHRLQGCWTSMRGRTPLFSSSFCQVPGTDTTFRKADGLFPEAGLLYSHPLLPLLLCLCLSRIPDPDFYPSWIPDPGSWISDPGSRIPDPGSRIPDPGSRIPDPKTATKERGEKNFVVIPFYVATNFTKL